MTGALKQKKRMAPDGLPLGPANQIKAIVERPLIPIKEDGTLMPEPTRRRLLNSILMIIRRPSMLASTSDDTP